MRVVVDVREGGGVHVHLQAALDAFERADGGLHAFRPEAVGEGDGSGGNAVFGIHPAGCAHADVLHHAARPVQVVVEVAAGVGMGILGIEIGRSIRIVISQDFCLCVLLRNGGAFFHNYGAAHLRGKVAEGFHHVRIVAVDVQVVGFHGSDHGNLREQLQEGAVKLVGFHHHGLVLGHQEVGAVVAGNAAQEGAAAFAGFRKDMGGKGGGGGFAVRAGNGQAALSAGNLTQGTGALEHVVPLVHYFAQFPEVGGNGRGVHHQRFGLVGGNQVGAVFVVHRNAFGLQLGREIGRRAVVTGHVQPLELIVPGNGRHSNSTNSYEVYVFHTSL